MRVMVIDDSRSSAAAIANSIDEIPGISSAICLDPEVALTECQREQFDLVLVDYIMPKLDGIEVLKTLRGLAPYRLVPMIMIASTISKDVKREAIQAGATDFLNKPCDWVELQARVKNLLALRQAQIDLADRARQLSAEVEAATARLVAREEEIIWRLARAVEYRDGTTGDHVSRVAEICRMIAEQLRLGPESARIIYLAAPLHDIGKIGISDAILQKPGRLTPEEMALMRRHVEFGAEILADASTEVVRVAGAIARTHHEKWDGTGYPAGLSGDEIPVEGRIVAIADVFDALCSKRPYKPAWPIEKAFSEIVSLSGSHFDPACVEAFVACWSRICSLMEAAGEEAAATPP
ncbi:HD domain-containing phosphohydrolase [Aurantimonas sp. VKM B-3413]|uniref:HD domain-containing phosphohydrolase n=1 Tax=Aurantimonas sp. VKM B-3413 TaxID=2779401 RepID=UPI001E5BEF3D|nr:HD domain-containing phosphohydrolase [Aurantimonas sp. VKM B-3413]MCB8836459.1 HD domain-containing protein [Aurantimonas sp. VKM B-3413]